MQPVLAFDLSGVIIHDIVGYNLTGAVLPQSGKLAAAQSKFPELFGRLTGKTDPLPESEFWIALALAAKLSEPETLRQAFLGKFAYHSGMRTLLAALQNMGVRTYVWTNMPNSWMDALHQQLGLEDLVTGYVNGQNMYWRKPERGFFRGALDRYELDADQVIYIGARKENLEAAKDFSAQQWLAPEASRIEAVVRRLLLADSPVKKLTDGLIADW